MDKTTKLYALTHFVLALIITGLGIYFANKDLKNEVHFSINISLIAATLASLWIINRYFDDFTAYCQYQRKIKNILQYGK